MCLHQVRRYVTQNRRAALGKQKQMERLACIMNHTKCLNEVIPLCINSIYLFYDIFPSTQHTSFEFTATCFDLTSHLQAYL